MTIEDVIKNNGDKSGQIVLQPEESVRIESAAIKSGKIFFWEKWAFKPSSEKDDQLRSFEVIHSPKIREIIRNLDSKLLGKKMSFLSDVRPKNDSVKRWIIDLKKSYPNPDLKDVENILDTFRSSLHSKSKEAYKSIVCILLMDDIFLLLHCKIDPSLVIMDNKIYSVDQILSTKNVYRAAIIRNEEGKITFSAYEYNRKWSKGHAEFWGIDPEYISWEELGNIILYIELQDFDYIIQLPIDSKGFDLIYKSGKITPTGKINIGSITGRILKAKIFRNEMSFENFFEFYYLEKEKLEFHVKKFNELIPVQKDLSSFTEQFRYVEDFNKIIENTPDGELIVYNKDHPTYKVLFFTNHYPGILPNHKIINSIYESIFNNTPMNIWHAGEDSSIDPLKIGSLKIYNKICDKPEICKFSDDLLNIIQDSKGKKEYYLLQFVFCYFWKNNLKGKHFKWIFDILMDRIMREIEFSFQKNGILSNEDIIEFKSADEVITKPSRFVNDKIMPLIKKYFEDNILSRYCILFGISDSGAFEPIYNIKSDQLSAIQDKTNEAIMLERIPLKVCMISIPYGEGRGRIIAMIITQLF